MNAQEQIVLTVWVDGGEHSDRNYMFDDWDKALEVAMNRAAEGFHTKVKRRTFSASDWEVKEFYPV